MVAWTHYGGRKKLITKSHSRIGDLLWMWSLDKESKQRNILALEIECLRSLGRIKKKGHWNGMDTSLGCIIFIGWRRTISGHLTVGGEGKDCNNYGREVIDLWEMEKWHKLDSLPFKNVLLLLTVKILIIIKFCSQFFIN